MKKGLEKPSHPGARVSNTKRAVKVFLINNHSPLEDLATRLADIIEQGSCKKIVAVRVAPNAQPNDDAKLVRQIIEGIEKAKKDMETRWLSLEGNLENEIWGQWMQSVEEPTAKFSIRFLKDSAKEHAGNGRDSTSNAAAELEDFEDLAELEEEVIPRPSLIARLISSADMKVLYDELRHRDLVIPDYYVVVFCSTTTPLIKDLLRQGVPLSAIIHFLHCPASEFKVQFSEVYKDLQEFKKSPETKHIGLFTSPLTMESLMESNPDEIYNQLKNYLFDIEMLSQHFLIYQSEFLEINDTLTSKESLIRSFHVRSSKESSDNTVVCVYLDNLFRMVETHTAHERRYSSFHPRPFLDNDYGRIIIEDANDFLKTAIATQMNLVSYWKAVDIVINAIRQDQTDSHCSVDGIKLPLYKELLSWESFAQRLEMVKGEYDHCCRKSLTEKFKLFVFRRTFHKVLETSRKFHLPTRVCFRDFCQYIAPRYVEVLRRRCDSFSLLAQESDRDEDTSSNDTFFLPSQTGEDGHGRETHFSGLTFDDAFQELTVVERTYRFHRSGCIRVRLENWKYRETKMTVEVNLFKCAILAHRWDACPAKLFSRVRLISRNGVTCNVEMSEDPFISIQWPNDCQIWYVTRRGLSTVEQRYYWATTGEYKRVYTNRGCVLVYLRNGVIHVLTPNGVFYQLYPEGYTDPEDSEGHSRRLSASTNVSIEVEFVRNLGCYGVDCGFFDVTKNDGRKIRVRNGVAVEERARYLVYEWMDLGYGEMFGERDDGVKLVSSYYGLKTYYPCGTMIQTVTEEEYIEVDLDCRSVSTENILRKINPDILRRLEERGVQRAIWLSFNLTHHVQHEKYAHITCYEETKMIIHSPDDVKVIATGDSVLIDVGVNVSLRFTPDLCTITSPYDNDMSIKLNLIPNNDEVLFYQTANAKMTLKEDGQLISDDDFIPDEPYDEELYFLTKQYKFGIAFIPEYEFHDILKKYKTSQFFYETPKKVVILKNVLPLSSRFSLPVAGMEENLDKLYLSKYRRKPRDSNHMEHVFSVRTIIKLDKVPKDLCDFLRGYTYIEMILSDNIQDALDHWFEVKPVKSKFSSAWKRKIKETTVEVQKNKERAPVYQDMLKLKVFPKYHDFLEAGGDVDNVNLKKLMPRLVRKGFKGRQDFKHL